MTDYDPDHIEALYCTECGVYTDDGAAALAPYIVCDLCAGAMLGG